MSGSGLHDQKEPAAEGLSLRIVSRDPHEHADPPHPRAENGHAAAALPRSVMNSRRLMNLPSDPGPHSTTSRMENCASHRSKNGPLMTASGQKTKYSIRAYVFRSGPNNGHDAAATACPVGAKSGQLVPKLQVGVAKVLS